MACPGSTTDWSLTGVNLDDWGCRPEGICRSGALEWNLGLTAAPGRPCAMSAPIDSPMIAGIGSDRPAAILRNRSGPGALSAVIRCVMGLPRPQTRPRTGVASHDGGPLHTNCRLTKAMCWTHDRAARG